MTQSSAHEQPSPTSSRRRSLVIGAIVLVLLVAAWATLALQAGMFISHDDRWVVAPSEVSDDGFAHQKRHLTLDGLDVSFVDVGEGPSLFLLHGCPFSAFEWKDVIPSFAEHYRVIAPDLLGLGDTPVRLNQDYRLPQDVLMVQKLMDALDIRSARFVGHDHGGATVLLLMQHDPTRIAQAILTNIEAYDQWPSKPELPYLKLIVNPLTSPLIRKALEFETVQREIFSIAVEDDAVLTRDVLAGYTLPHIATPARWQRLQRFFRWQLDPTHNWVTMTALPGMRSFEKPVLLLWGKRDENFGPHLANRLAWDIPGILGIHFLENSRHMPMQEEPGEYADAAIAFLADGSVSDKAIVSLDSARQSIVDGS